jgi:hypothetical protein
LPLSYESETPFDSIEGAQEYIKLLSQTVQEAAQGVQADLAAGGIGDSKQLEALRLVFYNLEKLSQHLKAGSRILNDLRTLRRLLLQERQPGAGIAPARPRNGKSEVPALDRETL